MERVSRAFSWYSQGIFPEFQVHGVSHRRADDRVSVLPTFDFERFNFEHQTHSASRRRLRRSGSLSRFPQHSPDSPGLPDLDVDTKTDLLRPRRSSFGERRPRTPTVTATGVSECREAEEHYHRGVSRELKGDFGAALMEFGMARAKIYAQLLVENRNARDLAVLCASHSAKVNAKLGKYRLVLEDVADGIQVFSIDPENSRAVSHIGELNSLASLALEHVLEEERASLGANSCRALRKPTLWLGRQAEWVRFPERVSYDVVVISDTHLGMDYGRSGKYRHQDELRDLIFMCHEAREIGMLIFVGDVFDSWAHSSVKSVSLDSVIESVRWFRQTIFEVTSSETPLTCVFIRGNHDDDLTAELLSTYLVRDPSLSGSNEIKRLRAGLHIVFGGDVFLLPSMDGLLVFTHGHIADAWCCRYWTGDREPYGRFLTGVSASQGKFEGSGTIRILGEILQTRFGRKVLNLSADDFVSRLEGLVSKLVVRTASCRRWNRIRTELFHNLESNEDVLQSLEIPVRLLPKVGLQRFGCLPRLNKYSDLRWLSSPNDLLMNLSLPGLGLVPDMLLKMFLPGAVGIFTGHVHGNAFVEEKTIFDSFHYVVGNTGDWHNGRKKRLGGIYISQPTGDNASYSTFTFKEVKERFIVLQDHLTCVCDLLSGTAVQICESQKPILLMNRRKVKLSDAGGQCRWFHGSNRQFVVSRHWASFRYAEAGFNPRDIFDRSCSRCRPVEDEEEGENEALYRVYECLGHERSGADDDVPAECASACYVGHERRTD